MLHTIARLRAITEQVKKNPFKNGKIDARRFARILSLLIDNRNPSLLTENRM